MFSLRPKKIAPANSLPFSASFDRDGIARIAIAENGKIVFASQAFASLSSLSPEETAGQDFWAVMRFDDHILEPHKIDTGTHTIRLQGQNQDVFDFHFDWLVTSDSRRYLIGSHTQEPTDSAPTKPAPLQNPLQEPQQNNTPQTTKTTQSDLNSDPDIFLNLSNDVFITMDDAGKIKSVNTAFCTQIGYNQADAINLDFLTLFEEEDRPFIHKTIKTNQNNASITDFEARIRCQNGMPRDMKWRQQRVGEHLYYAGSDITDIKSQKESLKRHEKQLTEAESLGRMGHWQWVLGEDAIEWSDEIYRIFGVEKNAFAPTLDTMNDHVHRDDLDRVNQALQRAIIEENDYDVEFRIKHPDGKIRYIRSEGRCSRNEDGEVIALFGIMQDMTEQVLHEADIEAAKVAAERAYNAKSQFLANMSHELRTPLNAIIGFSEMIERQLLGPIGTEKYLEYIGGIRESGEHLLDLISDILDMSKIEAGKYELMLEQLNLIKTVKLAVHMMEGRALESNVKITLAPIQDEALQIIADRRAFLQILLNLLSNAVKFSKENGEISIECYPRDEFIAIKIIDNGIGIPANKLATITHPFEQVSASYTREHDGSGLGLAITKELIELHGGELQIDSKVDIGTTVTIKLPYKPPITAQD